MNLIDETGPGDGYVHRQNLVLLQAAASTANFPILAGRSGGAFDGTDQGLYFASTPNQSPIWIVWSVPSNTLCIIIGGMDGYAQVPAVLASWAGTFDTSDSPNCFRSAANFILNNLPPAPGAFWSKVRIIGHSFGGAVAYWVAKLIGGFVGANVRRECYSYGAPKMISGGPETNLAGILYRAYSIGDDPVPRLPPGPEDMGSVWVLIGVPLARKWATWRQAAITYCRRYLGVLVVIEMPFRPQDTAFILSVLRWMTGSTCFGSDRHTLDAYQQDVQPLYHPPLINPAPEPIPTPRTRGTPSTTAMESLREVQIVTVAANNAAALGDTATGILSGTTLIPGVRFRGIRHQGKPWVFYGTEPITPCKTTRVRRALVRYLNRHPGLV